MHESQEVCIASVMNLLTNLGATSRLSLGLQRRFFLAFTIRFVLPGPLFGKFLFLNQHKLKPDLWKQQMDTKYDPTRRTADNKRASYSTCVWDSQYEEIIRNHFPPPFRPKSHSYSAGWNILSYRYLGHGIKNETSTSICKFHSASSFKFR